jgi:hypothetical protein
VLLPFELDPQIIHHIIYSQAGSIGKAIIELLMNSVDASATRVKFTMTKDGFECDDDGNGFASEEDVRRYFGRFGTPHAEGDATYGRFRLGRGQIMAHAKTVWRSTSWMMTVDTREMGYNYELSDLPEKNVGCRITGEWYEKLTDSELMSAIQEVRDLVRYTPIQVDLNGRQITRDPRLETWDREDDFAYYRAKEDGAVSIYNQGVLVRHDPAHIWGAGGLVVSKQAIGLNVSRTEILRKTCPVWKVIAKQFGILADDVASRLGDHRKTEARREKSARALLGGDPKIVELFDKEEVVTILPGKRHITMSTFLRKCRTGRVDGVEAGKFAVVENAFDVPKGEAIAREGIAVLLHPSTLTRFGCYSAIEFRECVERINQNVQDDVKNNGTQYWASSYLYVPELIDFGTLRDAFSVRTRIVSDTKALDKETRRAWTALKWCLAEYAAQCSGGRPSYGNRTRGGTRFHIFLGDSNAAEAWTDGKSYIAVDLKVVQRLRSHPLKVIGHIFSLIEHEVAHEGDSLDCGHDEAFYQRFHDIALEFGEDRQRFINLWVRKYTRSLEMEGKPSSGAVWRERFLLERAGSGREKKGLSSIIDELPETAMARDIPDVDLGFVELENSRLVDAGMCPAPPDWSAVLNAAREAQLGLEAQHLTRAAELQREAEEMREIEEEQDRWYQEHMAEMAQQEAQEQEASRLVRERLIPVLGQKVVDSLDDDELCFFNGAVSDDEIRAVCDTTLAQYRQAYFDDIAESEAKAPVLAPDLQALVRGGETAWTLERNAAAAGFFNVKSYLEWRASSGDAVGG